MENRRRRRRMPADMPVEIPADCIRKIISLTTPKDACRLSAVSSDFKRSADSDDVWEAFLPSNWSDLIDQSESTHLSKKQLYLHICDHPRLLANKNMINRSYLSHSVSLAKESGKKCYRIGPRALANAWNDVPPYWHWMSFGQSRFPEVAELKYVWWFTLEGGINTSRLSPNTTYDVLFIFRFERGESGFTNRPVNFSLTTEGGMTISNAEVVLEPPGIGVIKRNDGWSEVKVGEFFTQHHDDGCVSFKALVTGNHYTEEGGLLVEGVEFRPRS